MKQLIVHSIPFPEHKERILLTWIYFNPIMYIAIHPSCGMELFSQTLKFVYD